MLVGMISIGRAIIVKQSKTTTDLLMHKPVEAQPVEAQPVEAQPVQSIQNEPNQSVDI